jgi:hypothetical protein
VERREEERKKTKHEPGALVTCLAVLRQPYKGFSDWLGFLFDKEISTPRPAKQTVGRAEKFLFFCAGD